MIKSTKLFWFFTAIPLRPNRGSTSDLVVNYKLYSLCVKPPRNRAVHTGHDVAAASFICTLTL